MILHGREKKSTCLDLPPGASSPQRRSAATAPPPLQHPAIIWPCITLTRTHDHMSCARPASITCTRGQTRGSLKKRNNKKNKTEKTKHDYLITVWLSSPWINIRAEEQTVIESELIKVLLAEAEQKIQALGVVGPPTTACRFISSDLSLRCSFKGWWYLHTTEEGPGVSRSEGGPQQSKCHFYPFHPPPPVDCNLLLPLLCPTSASPPPPSPSSLPSPSPLPHPSHPLSLSLSNSAALCFCCFLPMESTCPQI